MNAYNSTLPSGELLLEQYPVVRSEPDNPPEMGDVFYGGGERRDGLTIIKDQTRIAKATVRFSVAVPDQITDPVPGLIDPGYGGIEWGYVALRDFLAKNGKVVATVEPARTQDMLAGWHPRHLFHPERLPSQTAWAVIRKVQKRDGYGLFASDVWDHIGHSMGGPTAASSSYHKRPYVRNIVLLGPAGVSGHNIWQLHDNARRFVFEELVPALPQLGQRHADNRLEAATDIAQHVFRNLVRTLSEAWATGNADIRPVVARLGGMGVGTAIVPFHQDRFFPLRNVKEHAGNVFQIFHPHHDETGGHLAPQLNPEAVGKDIHEVIERLTKMA